MENEIENITLAQNIRKIRDMRGFSQEYVAAKLDLSQPAYSRLELGKTEITEEVKEKIADVLGVSKQVLERYNDGIIFNYCTNSGTIGNGENTYTNNNYPIEEIKALYTKLLEEKDARIKLLEELNRGKK